MGASNRAIVIHKGLDNGDGDWQCGKDSGRHGCIHIAAAQHFMHQDHLDNLEEEEEYEKPVNNEAISVDICE